MNNEDLNIRLTILVSINSSLKDCLKYLFRGKRDLSKRKKEGIQ